MSQGRVPLSQPKVRKILDTTFGLSVSDDTVYRALKKLGFSHVSARPKAYKQNAEAMEAFKKTSPSVWRKSARSSHPTHR